jgi:hypothetical protein
MARRGLCLALPDDFWEVISVQEENRKLRKIFVRSEAYQSYYSVIILC